MTSSATSNVTFMLPKHPKDLTAGDFPADDTDGRGNGQAGALPQGGYTCTDVGNGRRLVSRHGENIRYCRPWKKWLIWDGKRWSTDETGSIYEFAKETVRSIYIEASNGGDSAVRKKLSDHASRSESSARIMAMVQMAQTEESIVVTPSRLDTDPFLLNVENGTLDLRSGSLRPHSREESITKLAPVRFVPRAQARRFRRFLNEIFSGNENIIRFMQRAIGYALTGDTREQCLFLLWGSGANGKTTFVETILTLLGDYGATTPFSTFLAKKHDGPGNDIARLQGARFVSVPEGNRNRGLDEALVKRVTGQDTVAARFLYKEFTEYRPSFKAFLVTNHLPRISSTEHAIWRRLYKVRFTERITPEKQDRSLAEKLRKELPGILNWAIEGCIAWRKHGLVVPEEVKAATESYREQENALGSFVDACCVLDSEAKTAVADLRAAYRDWCAQNGKAPVPNTEFGKLLTRDGFIVCRGTAGKSCRSGIQLKPQGATLRSEK